MKNSLQLVVTSYLWQKGSCHNFFRRQPCIVHDKRFNGGQLCLNEILAKTSSFCDLNSVLAVPYPGIWMDKP